MEWMEEEQGRDDPFNGICISDRPQVQYTSQLLIQTMQLTVICFGCHQRHQEGVSRSSTKNSNLKKKYNTKWKEFKKYFIYEMMDRKKKLKFNRTNRSSSPQWFIDRSPPSLLRCDSNLLHLFIFIIHSFCFIHWCLLRKVGCFVNCGNGQLKFSRILKFNFEIFEYLNILRENSTASHSAVLVTKS